MIAESSVDNIVSLWLVVQGSSLSICVVKSVFIDIVVSVA